MTRSRMHEKNPYDFVPFEGKPTYQTNPPTLALVHGLTGTICFDVDILTPLCIHQDPGQTGVRDFAILGGQSVIPATSLKGMLRSVHEVVTNSTLGIVTSRPRGWNHKDIPRAYMPGQSPDRLTPSEALFGMVGAARSDDAVGHAGHVLVRDVPVDIDLKPQSVSRPSGGQPKPAHRSFYVTPDGQILGRKFYYHQHDYERVLHIYAVDRRMPTVKVESVPSGTRLSGQMQFCNISEHDLAALVYALVLEDHLAHKLGYGKPLGLGSVRIHITCLLVERQESAEQHLPARFLTYGDATLEDWTARVAWLRDRAKDIWLKRVQGSASYRAFATIARWPQTENFLYPDFGFFRKERGLSDKTPLWHYQGRPDDQPHPDTPATATTVQVSNAPPPVSVVTDRDPTAPCRESLPDAATSDVPAAPPPPSSPPARPRRRTGRLEQRGPSMVVVDEETGHEYPKIGQLPKKLQRILKPGQVVLVSYRIGTAIVEGQEQDVAEDLFPTKGGNP